MARDAYARSGAQSSLIATPRAVLFARLRSFIADATPEQIAEWE